MRKRKQTSSTQAYMPGRMLRTKSLASKAEKPRPAVTEGTLEQKMNGIAARVRALETRVDKVERPRELGGGDFGPEQPGAYEAEFGSQLGLG